MLKQMKTRQQLNHGPPPQRGSQLLPDRRKKAPKSCRFCTPNHDNLPLYSVKNRLWSTPTTNSKINYHDKKRRIEYFRIVKEIEDENKKNPDKPPKEIVGDKPEPRGEFSVSQGSKILEDKFYGNLLDDITLDRSKTTTINKEKNASVTMQELNQKLEEIVQGRKFPLEDLERDLRNQKLATDEEDKLSRFLAFLKDKEIKQNFKTFSHKTTDLKLDEDILKQSPLMIQPPKTAQPRLREPKYPMEGKSEKVIQFDHNSVKMSPQSARNGYQINNTPHTAGGSPFFLSEAMAQRMQQQQGSIQKQPTASKKPQAPPSSIIQNTSQALPISPRNASNQQSGKSQLPSPTMLSQFSRNSQQQQLLALQIQQSIQMHLQQPKLATKQVVKQSSTGNLMKASMPQGLQGSQEAYQMQNGDITNQVLSAKNSTSSVVPPNNPKNTSKMSAMITAESSPSLKQQQQCPIVGSQTHRVTTQATIGRFAKKLTSNSKESLNKLLSPVNPLTTKKEINDNFLLQIQSMKQQQKSSVSKPLIKSTAVTQQKISNQTRRGTKGVQFRKSLEQNLKFQFPAQTHQHTKSDANNQNLPEAIKQFQ